MKRLYSLKMPTTEMYKRSQVVYYVEESAIGLGYRLRYLNRESNRFNFMDIIHANVGR